MRLVIVWPASIRRAPVGSPRHNRGRRNRAWAWAYVGLGLAEKGQGQCPRGRRPCDPGDRPAPGIGSDPELVHTVGGVRVMYPTNPAAVILPVVERAAPDRLAEVFWRAVALHPRLETDREEQLQTSYIGFECVLLSHYDRGVAATLFEPMDFYLRRLRNKGPRTEFASSHIVAKACIDPRAAICPGISDTASGVQPSYPRDRGAAHAGRGLGPAARKAMDASLALE